MILTPLTASTKELFLAINAFRRCQWNCTEFISCTHMIGRKPNKISTKFKIGHGKILCHNLNRDSHKQTNIVRFFHTTPHNCQWDSSSHISTTMTNSPTMNSHHHTLPSSPTPTLERMGFEARRASSPRYVFLFFFLLFYYINCFVRIDFTYEHHHYTH